MSVPRVVDRIDQLVRHHLFAVVAWHPLFVDAAVFDVVRGDGAEGLERVVVAAERDDVIDLIGDARIGGRDEGQRAADAGAEESDARRVHLGQ